MIKGFSLCHRVRNVTKAGFSFAVSTQHTHVRVYHVYTRRVKGESIYVQRMSVHVSGHTGCAHVSGSYNRVKCTRRWYTWKHHTCMCRI